MPIRIEGEPRETRSTKNNLSPQKIGRMLNPIAGSLPGKFPFVHFYMMTLGLEIEHADDNYKEIACEWNKALERLGRRERLFVTRSIKAKLRTAGISTLEEVRAQLKNPNLKSKGLGKKGTELLSALLEKTSQNEPPSEESPFLSSFWGQRTLSRFDK